MDQAALQRLQQNSRIRAQFYFDEHHGKDLCKVWVVGDTGNVLREVTPEVIAEFPNEWETYQKTGGGDQYRDIGGTPLREIPGMSESVQGVLRYNAVLNAEQLAALDEHTVRQWGPGFLEIYRSAKFMLQAKEKAEQERELIELRALLEESKKKRGPGRPRKDEGRLDGLEEPQEPDTAA